MYTFLGLTQLCVHINKLVFSNIDTCNIWGMSWKLIIDWFVLKPHNIIHNCLLYLMPKDYLLFAQCKLVNSLSTFNMCMNVPICMFCLEPVFLHLCCFELSVCCCYAAPVISSHAARPIHSQLQSWVQQGVKWTAYVASLTYLPCFSKSIGTARQHKAPGQVSKWGCLSVWLRWSCPAAGWFPCISGPVSEHLKSLDWGQNLGRCFGAVLNESARAWRSVSSSMSRTYLFTKADDMSEQKWITATGEQAGSRAAGF